MGNRPVAIVMCDYWFPQKSANSICVEKLIGPLSRRYDVKVIAADGSDAPRFPSAAAVGDIPVNRLLEKTGRHPLANRVIKIANRAVVAWYVPRYPLRSMEWAGGYERACREMLEGGGVELVVATCFPGECLEAAIRLKREYPAVRFVAYFLDEVAVGMYRKGALLRHLTERAAVRFEKRAIAALDGALFLSGAKGLVERNHPGSGGKIGYVDVPLMVEDTVSHRIALDESGASTILYAGTLANPDRNPARFIDALSPLGGPGGVRLRFAGDAAGLLEGEERVDELGVLSPDECDAEMGRSTALLSIGNRDPNLVPSKLFKYMSLGKPIIHLRRGGRDSCLPYLERYPLGLVVDDEQEGFEGAVLEFLASLPGKDGLEIPLRELFPMAYPDYTVSAIATVGTNNY